MRSFAILKLKPFQLQYNCFHFRCTIVEIPQEHSLEIDKPFDLELARFIDRIKSHSI